MRVEGEQEWWSERLIAWPVLNSTPSSGDGVCFEGGHFLGILRELLNDSCLGQGKKYNGLY